MRRQHICTNIAQYQVLMYQKERKERKREEKEENGALPVKPSADIWIMMPEMGTKSICTWKYLGTVTYVISRSVSACIVSKFSKSESIFAYLWKVFICLVKIWLRTEIPSTPSSTWLWFELMTARSWQYVYVTETPALTTRSSVTSWMYTMKLKDRRDRWRAGYLRNHLRAYESWHSVQSPLHHTPHPGSHHPLHYHYSKCMAQRSRVQSSGCCLH